jgi:hypothetical protein
VSWRRSFANGFRSGGRVTPSQPGSGSASSTRRPALRNGARDAHIVDSATDFRGPGDTDLSTPPSVSTQPLNRSVSRHRRDHPNGGLRSTPHSTSGLPRLSP